MDFVVKCRLHKERLEKECDHLSPLQSWGPELRFFTELPHRPIDSDLCNVVIDKPTYFMKIDASELHCFYTVIITSTTVSSN